MVVFVAHKVITPSRTVVIFGTPEKIHKNYFSKSRFSFRTVFLFAILIINYRKKHSNKGKKTVNFTAYIE